MEQAEFQIGEGRNQDRSCGKNVTRFQRFSFFVPGMKPSPAFVVSGPFVEALQPLLGNS